MGIFQRILNRSPSETRMKMVTEYGTGFYAWDGRIYQSDIVRSCIRPKVKSVGKLVGKHIRETIMKDGKRKVATNPEPYLRFLLEEPNPYMSGQMFQQKMATQLALNNNAFALIMRDEAGFPVEIYPIPAVSAEAKYDPNGELFIIFILLNGKNLTAPYKDIIHLREDFNNNDIFGEPLGATIAPLMNVVTTVDQGIIKAIKNSSVIQWLIKFTQSLRTEDLKTKAEEFAQNYLSVDGGGIGVAAIDGKMEATRVEPKDYVPNAAQMDRTTKRIYALFNTNEKIVMSSYDEDDWNSYFESEIEPISIQLSDEFTRKIFTRRERGTGNRIFFEAYNLQYASMSTKLALVAMVDRAAMTPNEWRSVLNLSPLDGGDDPIRRLDTAVVNQIKNLANKLGGSSDKEIIETINRLIEGR